ncbi:hypothetical protein M9H77_31870 [Catharanthus roseus]|uniref:Uncharacterized protein n=1 Tax=Catharanthus roseus TaxID=4058 RepID=A0ACC0A5H9_CATRO|nr:hypothetical protein M9H77_31870 [Catharanthus roseus]
MSGADYGTTDCGNLSSNAGLGRDSGTSRNGGRTRSEEVVKKKAEQQTRNSKNRKTKKQKKKSRARLKRNSKNKKILKLDTVQQRNSDYLSGLGRKRADGGTETDSAHRWRRQLETFLSRVGSLRIHGSEGDEDEPEDDGGDDDGDGDDDDDKPVPLAHASSSSHRPAPGKGKGLTGSFMSLMSKIAGSRQKRPEKSHPLTNPTQRKKAKNDGWE